jgi:hypothetical protein
MTQRTSDVRELGPMPADRRHTTVDERRVRAPMERVFRIAADVASWPVYLRHYRYVRMLETAPDGGGLVEMSAVRPFGPLAWPTWWTSEMQVLEPSALRPEGPAIRFRHVAGITRGMDVAWTFHPDPAGTLVRIVHVWNGPRWPLIGHIAAGRIIGPVFVHGIASRTLAGLAQVAESNQGAV